MSSNFASMHNEQLISRNLQGQFCKKNEIVKFTFFFFLYIYIIYFCVEHNRRYYIDSETVKFLIRLFSLFIYIFSCFSCQALG